MAPRVSVVIPCYNLGRYVDEAVGSVLAQTFQDFEIAVIDDGSTEPGTQALLATYVRPKTRVIRTENRGLPAAKNLGIASTSGLYVCALDADDRLEPTMLEKSVARLDADPDLAFVSHWLRTFGDEEREWAPERCDLPALLDMNTVNGAALVRRAAAEAIGGYDETMRDGCEDWDFWITLVERGYRGAIIPEVLFHYRRRPNSMSRMMMEGDRHPRLYRRLVDKHAATYRQHVPTLLARREEDITGLWRHLHDLEIEHERWLRPELERRRDDLGMLQRRASEERAKAQLARAGVEVEAARQEARRLSVELRAATFEVEALRASLSWRVTAPLRLVYGWLLAATGRRR